LPSPPTNRNVQGHVNPVPRLASFRPVVGLAICVCGRIGAHAIRSSSPPEGLPTPCRGIGAGRDLAGSAVGPASHDSRVSWITLWCGRVNEAENFQDAPVVGSRRWPVELGEDGGDVLLDAADRQVHVIRDRLVGSALGEAG
jgi:hypothetical protein